MINRTIVKPTNQAGCHGATAFVEKYGGEARHGMIRMQPEHLSADELEYELVARGLFIDPADTRARTGTLRHRLFFEYKRDAPIPTISPLSLEADLHQIDEKLNQLTQAMQVDVLDEHMYHRISIRLAHLEQRVARLFLGPGDDVKVNLGNRVEVLIRGGFIDYNNNRAARAKGGAKKKEVKEPSQKNTETEEGAVGPTVNLEFPKPVKPIAEGEAVEKTVANIQLNGTPDTFDQLMGMFNKGPEAQSTQWTNRDSLGSAFSTKSVHFAPDINSAGDIGHRLINRTATPYPRGELVNQSFGTNLLMGPQDTMVGAPGDFMGQSGPAGYVDPHESIARNIWRDHEAVMDREGTNRTSMHGRDMSGGRTFPVANEMFVTPPQAGSSMWGSQVPNTLGSFGGLTSAAQPVNNNFGANNIFGMLTPGPPMVQNRVNVNNDIPYGRNSSVFGHFNRTKATPVHQWGFKFSGEDKRVSDQDVGANEFIFRVDGNKRMQGLSDADILSQIGMLLTHRASTWYWASQHLFTSWQSFVDALRRTFLSTYHMIDSLDEISRRTQGKTESALTFLYEMLLKFRTLPQQVEERVQAHIIVRNLLPEIQANVGPWGPVTIADLERILSSMQPRNLGTAVVENKPAFRRPFVRRANSVAEAAVDEDDAGVFEITEEELFALKREREIKKGNRVVVANRAAAAVDEKNVRPRGETGLRLEDMKCFNCQDMGHGFRKCPKDRVGRFCFRCGKHNVTTNDCTDCPKNQVNCLVSEEEIQAVQDPNNQ